ncbi:uncharacterized protein LOC141716705 isoform X2 [Apium graveolens]|uniref:uncharacterized protein LOC141716705 isoform X2 n=1 Tax=Apium graveolens TaxID=4045 RepID=UPI003D7B7B18
MTANNVVSHSTHSSLGLRSGTGLSVGKQIVPNKPVFGKSVHLAISNPRLCDNALGEEVPTDFQFYKKKHITPADLAKFYICMPVSSHSGGKSV